MVEVNFCPYCDSPQHKLVQFGDDLIFCKECNRFFKLKQVYYRCWKCNSKRIEDSGYPSPNGELVFQCMSCKKMFPQSEFFKKNKIEEK